MTQNNLSFEEAKEILEEWESHVNNFCGIACETAANLIEASRMVQKAEDANLVVNYVVDMDGHVTFDDLKKLEQLILNPEAPLSDNQ